MFFFFFLMTREGYYPIWSSSFLEICFTLKKNLVSKQPFSMACKICNFSRSKF